ncbi:MAG: hypothetical protein EXR72_02585 [Myxococcales bacterium]|nr:hypothetical protein [Myxococcales bacterium]
MKTFIAILLASLFCAVGEALISVGMKQSGDASALGSLSIWKLAAMFANPRVLVGIGCMALFLTVYSVTLSWADLSFTQPLTALTFVFGTLIARLFLQEDVSPWRWVGTAVIVIGIVLVSMDGNQLTAPRR